MEMMWGKLFCSKRGSFDIESRVFPGLRLEVEALLSGNPARVLAELQKGIASAQHRAFIERLSVALKKRDRMKSQCHFSGENWF
jgi:hypothetical protein